MAFVERKIKLTFNLGEGSFGTSGANSVTLEDLRVSTKIMKAGGNAMSTMSMQVYGMTLSNMNKLSTLGMVPTLVRRNTVTVEAGDDEVGMSTVFIGTITNAYPDFNQMPNVAFQVQAHTGLIESLASVPPSSYPGATDAAVIMQSLATKMSLAFENTGVQVQLPPGTYFSGSAREQAIACAKAGGFKQIIDLNKLAIWPAGQARGDQSVLVSKDTGLILEPSYTSNGIMFRSQYNPNIGFGSKIQMQSILQPANNQWIVYSLFYDLDSKVNHGKWELTAEASPPGYTVVS